MTLSNTNHDGIQLAQQVPPKQARERNVDSLGGVDADSIKESKSKKPRLTASNAPSRTRLPTPTHASLPSPANTPSALRPLAPLASSVLTRVEEVSLIKSTKELSPD